VPDKDNNLPLHLVFPSLGSLAMQEVALKFVQVLVDCTSDLNRYNVKKMTPLMLAVKSDNIKAFEFAVDHKKNKQRKQSFNFKLLGGDNN
jgi:ankyrin repeat protein